MIFSILPDIDETKSKISHKFKILSKLINILLGHRGLIHSLWICILLYFFLLFFSKEIALAASLGYLSHLILDSFTVMGVNLFWPFPLRLRGIIKTGSWIENLIFIGLLMIDVYLLISF
jgi:inner membrane protein